MRPVYLDYAATTPVDNAVAEAMQAVLAEKGLFGNPSSQHRYGEEAQRACERARAQVAALIGAEASEIIWTSGATESNNLAIKGAVCLYQNKGKHVVAVKTEHKSVLDVCQHLEKQGHPVTYLRPGIDGRLDASQFKAALREDTVLASVMHVNNETGVVQDVQGLAVAAAERGVLFHVDAAQSAGKVAIDVKQAPIDLLSLSAHKLYGPKGVGALYLRKRPRVRVAPLVHGGGHEQGMRSGTLPTHQLVGMGEACALAGRVLQDDWAHAFALRSRFLAGVGGIDGFGLNSSLSYSVPHIVNVRFAHVGAEALLALSPDVAASTGSACQGKETNGSYVLRAMGLSEDVAKCSVRFSFGRQTALADIDHAVQCLWTAVEKLKEKRQKAL